MKNNNFRVAALQKQNAALTFTMPGANIRWGGYPTVRESFRAWLDQQFYNPRTRFSEADPTTSLRSTLFHLAALRPSELGTGDPHRLRLHKDRTVMYDIKTHDADYVRANLELYEQQLNVYAHIWQALRQQPLDEMAIIATDYPEAVQVALTSGDPEHLAYALERWDPVVPILFDARRVEMTIREFSTVVDAIEENHFAPRTVDDLNAILPGTRAMRFATRVCRNCDARFSCSAYREYAWRPGQRGVAEERFRQYYEETLPDAEQEQWRAAGLEAALDAGDARADYA